MNRNPITTIRRSKYPKFVAAFIAVNIITQLCFPTLSFALTSGPGQEEFSSFEPASTSDMVDLYSGDFNYNIPLLSIPGPNGGYPINIAYHSGVSMEQEASWVGLGWSLNVGSVNRQLRGLPDDYAGGDAAGHNVIHTQKFGTSTTVGLDYTQNLQAEIFGIGVDLGIGVGLYYNNFRGLGSRVYANISYPASNSGVDAGGAGIGVGISFDSQTGIGIEPDFSVRGQNDSYQGTASISIGYNSRSGLQDFSFSTHLGQGAKGTAKNKKTNKTFNTFEEHQGSSSTVSFGVNQVPSHQTMPMSNHEYSLAIDFPMLAAWPVATGITFSLAGSVSISKTANNGSSPNSVMYNSGYGYINSTKTTPGGTNTEMDFHRDEIKYSDKIPNLAPSSLNYDLFTQTGQGTGSMFRPYLNSNGIVTDPLVQSTVDNTDLTVEFGTGNLIHVKGGVVVTSGTNTSGPWQAQSTDDIDAGIQSMFGFSDRSCTDPLYEDYYWQVYGEKSAILLGNDYLSTNWAGDQAMRVTLGVQNSPDWLNSHFVAQEEFTTNGTNGTNIYNDPVINAMDYKNQQIVSNNPTYNRSPRGTNIETFTNTQASEYGYSKDLTYDDITSGTPTITSKNFHLTGSSNAPNAISEISVLQNDGMRYTYGLPQYNNYQLDATFSVTGPDNNDISKAPIPTQNGINIDASTTVQDYLNQTELTQPYASSWLLTSVVSDDYVDLTGDGPTPDDYGYWVKFNYKKTSSNYNWRVPYVDANYIEGVKNYSPDDKGTVSWGNKELYYVESIETKTHVAYFYTSPRQDGVGANGSNLLAGGISYTSGNTMYKLDSIQLYTRAAFGTGTTPATGAIPIKTIHFQYTYDLCPSVPNNTTQSVDAYGNIPASKGPNVNSNNGKLTLTGLYFTYEGTTRGLHSPYTFTYGASNSNISYNDTYQDRWGSFKDNSIYAGTPYPAHDFPYTDVYNYGTSFTQNNGSSVGEYNAALWNLTTIGLPTGGAINIRYAQKDYAYVENQRAQAMFDIVDVGANGGNMPNWTASNDLSDRTQNLGAVNTYTNGSRIWFKLKQPVTGSLIGAGSSYIYNNYLEGGNLSTIYYKVYCDLVNKGGAAYYLSNGNATSDYVCGYANVDYSQPYNYGTDATGKFGYLTLQTVPLNATNYTGINLNPITLACIEYIRADRPELLYPSYVANVNGTPLTLFWNLIGGVLTFLTDLDQMVTGFNDYALQLNYGKNIYLNGRSVIRLEEPTGEKWGGGVKVTQLTLQDNWVNGGSQNFDYGQNYDYTTTDPNGNIISSGVAYEPEIGNEESALCTPVDYTLSTPLSSNYHLFLENPIMRSYYPGASVGYGKVTVTSIGKGEAYSDNTNNILANSAAPVSTYEFYTPKDFPVASNQTDLSTDAPLTRPFLIPGLYSSLKKRKARSQGYSVVLNDMAGKLKSVIVRAQPVGSNPIGTLISEKDYNYQTVQPYNPNSVNQLSDTVQVLMDDGHYASALLGQSSDVFSDMNEDVQQSTGAGVNFDVDIGIPFLFFAFPIPYFSYSQLSLRTVVTNKAIYRTGILDSIVTTTDNSKVVEKNLAYDPQTGEPLLTSVTNQYNTPIYNYSYPAYWYYPNMGGAYQNFGVSVNPTGCSNNFYTAPTLTVSTLIYGGDINLNGNIPNTKSAPNYFTTGDQVWLDYASGGTTGQYTVVNSVSNIITCIDANGNYAPGGTLNSIRVIKSGYKNLQSMKAGTLVTEGIIGFTPFNPSIPTTATSTSVYHPQYSTVIDAKAVQYSDQWGIMCNSNCIDYSVKQPFSGPASCNLVGDVVNPYLNGLEGIWRPSTSWAYDTTRTQVNDIQTDGVYSHFTPFPWANPSSIDPKWVNANTITQYSPYGFELENKNAIGVYSAAIYGYNNSLVTAVGSNARYNEIAFDGFEDYPGGGCADNDFRFDYQGAGNIVSTQAHTGLYSMKVFPEGAVSLTRNLSSNSSCSVNSCSSDDGVPINQGNPFIGAQPGPPQAYTPFTFTYCDCIGEFGPIAGKQYVFSAWVKEIPQGSSTPSVNTLVTYPSPAVVINFYNTSNTIIGTTTMTPSGNIIEGWQRIYGTFTVPLASTNIHSIAVALYNNSATSSVFYDDVRIHPFNGNLNTYVYNSLTFKVMAELDPNNYATFYNYDDEGHLTKIKKETVEGIETIKEGRINNVEQ